MAKPAKHVFVCTQNRPPAHPRGSCGGNGSQFVLQEFMQQFESRGLWGKYAVTGCGCLGACGMGSAVLVYPEGVLYTGVEQNDVAAIIDEHLIGDKPIERLKVPAEFWS